MATEPKPWGDIAAGFDPNMPAEQYDLARRQYFDNVVRPRLSRQDNPLAAWEHFKGNTERQHLSKAGSMALTGAMAVTGFAKGVVTPIARGVFPNDKGAQDTVKSIEKFDETLRKAAGREGKSTLPAAAGEFAGSLLPFAVGAEAVELTGLPALTESVLGQRIIRGSLSLGAFEAASAKNGEGLVMGAKGALIGAAFEGTLGLTGKLMKRGIPKEEVDKIVAKVMQGEPVAPEVDEIVAEEIKKSSEATTQEARPKVVQENPKVKGVNIIIRDGQGQPQVIKVRPAAESAAIKEAQNYIKTGGQVEGIHFEPSEWSATQKFMARMSNETEAKFDGAKIIRTTERSGSAVAAELNLGTNGPQATAVSDSEVIVQREIKSRPDSTTVDSRLQDLHDEEGYPITKGARANLRRSVEALWDDKTPLERKGMIADQIKQWGVDDLIPEEFVKPKQVGEPLVEPTDQDLMKRASELGLSEEELAQLEGRINQPGKEEIYGKEGEKKGFSVIQPVNNVRIPTSERLNVEMTPSGPHVTFSNEINISQTPRRYGIQLSTEDIENRLPGAEAVTRGPDYLTEALSDFGHDIPIVGKYGDLPAIIYKDTPSKRVVYHEGLHVDKFHVPGGSEVIQLTNQEGSEAFHTAAQIGAALKTFPAYKHLEDWYMREEAFVHAATAIRIKDADALSQLIVFDTSLEHITRMVQDVSARLLDTARSSIDTAPARVLQRKMQDLLVRTGEDRMWELKNATKNLLSDMWYDPESGHWKLMESNGATHSVPDLDSVADFIHDSYGANFYPSSTLQAEMSGIRGPFTPRGGSAIKDPPPMDTAPDTRWKGWTAASGLFRPMGPWVADLHTRVNDALSSLGRKLPIYDRWKDVDDAFRGGSEWMGKHYDELADLLEGVGKKQHDYFDVLTTDPKHWKGMADKLNLDEKDLNKIAGINNWFLKFKDDTGINAFNWMRDELPRLRGHNFNSEFVYTPGKLPKDMSTFERLMHEGKLDPKQRHIGSFTNTLLREGFEQKFSDKPLKELEKLVNSKAKDGSYILGNMRYPLENYVRYMRGQPDVTAQVMTQGVKDFQRFLGEKAAQLNKHLPDNLQLPTEFQYPGAIINKLLVWSYAAGLGLRASIPIRDALQVFSTTLPVLGPAKFAKGLAYFAQNGFKFAEENGALLKRHNIGELYGDIFSELPPGASTDRITKLAQKLLSPSRGGHNIGRAVGFYGEYFSALDAIGDYRSGKITIDELVKDRTSLWWNDKPVVERMIDSIHSDSPEEAAKKIANEIVDLTLWPYRRGTQPTALRTGAGRIFGQFGMWPMNYLDFLRRGTLKLGEHPKQASSTIALWAASNYAAVQSLQAVGADADKWFFVSPAGYGLSPHAQFVLDLGKAWEETPDGREARKRVLEYPLDFFPAQIEGKNIYEVLQSGAEPFDSNGHPTPELLKVLGFRPLKENTTERTFDEQIKYELGLSGKRAGR